MDKTKEVLMYMKKFGRLSKSRIAALIGTNTKYAAPVLEDMINKKLIKRTVETNSTYFELV